MNSNKGFALPTILIASVVMLIVLISAVSAATSVRTALNSQYYTQLAREAAESGLARAIGCLKSNNYVAQWNTASALRPQSGCTGGVCAPASQPSCYVMQQDNVRSAFFVGTVDNKTNYQIITSEGTVTLSKESSGGTWRTYDASASATIGTDGSVGPVMFGQ